MTAPTPQEVLAATFPDPGRVPVSSDTPCDYYTPCEHRSWGNTTTETERGAR